MAFDYYTLKTLRQTHPAWKLLVADHAPLIAAFLHKAFIVPNHRSLSRADLASTLEDFLFILRETELSREPDHCVAQKKTGGKRCLRG